MPIAWILRGPVGMNPLQTHALGGGQSREVHLFIVGKTVQHTQRPSRQEDYPVGIGECRQGITRMEGIRIATLVLPLG